MTCPVCGATSVHRRRAAGDYTLWECSACGVGFADPMRAADSSWYETSPLYWNAKLMHPSLGWHHRRFLERAGAGAGRTLLDVGCGTGAFLDRARAAGFVPAGLDFDRDNVRIARERYALSNVHSGAIEDLAQTTARFDVVTLFEVIEHVADPMALLACVRRLLSRGGRLALSTPNRDRSLDALRRGDLPPNHLTRWTAGALARALERAGFGAVSVDVKPFAADEVEAWLRARVAFGVARRALATGVATGDAAALQRAGTLMRIKDRGLRCVALPAAPLGRALGWRGSGLLAVASA